MEFQSDKPVISLQPIISAIETTPYNKVKSLAKMLTRSLKYD